MGELSFRTKTGRCVIHADRLVLEHAGTRGAIASGFFGASMNRVRVFYGISVAGLVANAALSAQRDQLVGAVLFSVLAMVLTRNVLKTRGLSATPILLRAAITRIDAHPPVAPVARGHFVVHFVENGDALRRLVILPGVLEGGAEEYARALELLRTEGLPISR